MIKNLFALFMTFSLFAYQTIYGQGPAVTSWLQNTTNTGTYYTSGNSTAQSNGILVNCQKVEYSTNNVYITTKGIPAYSTGPFLDGNPSQASDQNAIFKFPLNPTQNTGTPTATTGGNIGVFINGVAMFDYRDGVAWNSTTNSLCGGPGNPPCSGTVYWNRDAVKAEKPGFDCSKGHPAMGNYHHHQNPSAFKLDKTVISTICNLYDADGLYTIDSTKHSPLIGFTYDGFPVYGAYAYKNTDGTGGIVRIKSSYQLKNMTTRTNGPAVNTTYYLGYFREDYEYISHPSDPDYLDEHNGRFCKTPEYPNGIYCYFATVDENWNSAYPYLIGPTFYGVYANRKVSSVTETTTVYTPTTSTLSATPDSITLAATTGSNGNITITSNINWTASIDQSWASINKTSGSNNDAITVTAQANTGSERIAYVTISASGLSDKKIKVKQVAPTTLFLEINPSTTSISSTGSSTTSFQISSNTSWSISGNPSWVTVNPTSGSNNASIDLNIAANTTISDRNATLVIGGTGVVSKSFTILQSGQASNAIADNKLNYDFSIYPVNQWQFMAIQVMGLVKDDIQIELYDLSGKLVSKSEIISGQTISYLNTETLYNGVYFLKLINNQGSIYRKIKVDRS